MHRRPNNFVKSLRILRRAGRVNEFVSVYIHHVQRTVYIASDGGRVCRPLIIVENGKPRITPKHVQELSEGVRSFADCIRDGIIEFLDVNEENDSFLAMREEAVSKQTTHLEIEPLTLLGVVAGLIPYPHHNQSPRNTYQCAMGKQSLGATAYNQFERIDSLMYLMSYPQRPMCSTKTLTFINFENLPAGNNAMIAVMSYSGYDIEDALILNRASIDRGYGRCMVYKRFAAEIKKYPNNTSDMLHPPPPEGNSSYRVLGPDGICEPGEVVNTSDIYLNKFIPNNAFADIITGATGPDAYDHKPAR